MKKKSESKNDTNSKDLGDLMGLDRAPDQSLSDLESSPQELPPEEIEEIEDSAGLTGPSPAKKGARPRTMAHSASRRTHDSRTVLKQKAVRHRSKEAPVLWMLEPQKYPRVLESFRLLENKAITFKEKGNLKTFLLTGSEEKVGVSTVTFNLGLVMSLSLADQRILLIDANLSNPSLHLAFGRALKPGLMEYLFEGLSLTEIIQPSPLPNLDLICIGQFDNQVISPFDSLEFSNFLKEAKRHYSFILLDSAPALRSGQTRNISSKVDGVIVVAEANRTRWQVVSELKRQLESDEARLIGTFLNKRRFVIPKWVYRFA
jgi:Mrp family chromosome partitioning ATPase